MRLRVEQEKPVTLSRDATKQIIMELTKMQGDADLRLSKVDVSKAPTTLSPQVMM